LQFVGGGAGFYRAGKDLPDGCPAVVPIQLPGRDELFDDPESRGILLPLLRADVRMHENLPSNVQAAGCAEVADTGRSVP
jgi:surfactin synthase thioesterase subunit